MVAAVAGGVSVKGALLLPTVWLPPGVRTPREQVHHDSSLSVVGRCCSARSSTPTSRCACPCAMLFASPAFTGGLLQQAYLYSQPKLEKGRGPGCYCVAVLWPPLYLWFQPKLEEGRGAGCCCGAVLWPPSYPWPQPKLEKGRGPGCCCGAVLWPPSYLSSRTKLEKERGAGCCCGAVL